MQSLCSIAFECIGGLTKKSPAPGADLRREILRVLAAYAMECLAFRRPRGSFGGRLRSIAFGALNLLAETGAISESQALDLLDAWKERNETRG